MDKLDRWAEDQRRSLKADLDDLDAKIKETKKRRGAPRICRQSLIFNASSGSLRAKRNEAWKEYDESSRNVERKKDGLLDEISQRLNQKTERKSFS